MNEGSMTDELGTIAQEAYIYLYPLVTMDLTRRQLTNIESGRVPGRGPMNTFAHIRTFPNAHYRDGVRPNFDTLYSTAWLDVSREPMVISAPDTQGRYYLLSMLDMWTDVFAVPGKRTTGTCPGHWAIVGPGWTRQLAGDLERITSPTPHVWMIGRTQTNGPEDYAAVKAVQDGFVITPLSQWGRERHPVNGSIDPTVDMVTPPLEQIKKMPPLQFFSYAAELLKINPPHFTDQPIIARMKRLGLAVGRSFDTEKADPAIRRALEQGAADGFKAMQAAGPAMGRLVNGWQINTTDNGSVRHQLPAACRHRDGRPRRQPAGRRGLSGVAQRQRRETHRWQQSIPGPLRQEGSPSRRCLLVADLVRPERLSLRQSDQSLRDRRPG